jgi:hypothetical protein
MLKEDMAHIGRRRPAPAAARLGAAAPALASESVTRHTLYREETRWPGYYYRGDHMKLDDENWHCFTLSQFDRHTGSGRWRRRPSITSSTDAPLNKAAGGLSYPGGYRRYNWRCDMSNKQGQPNQQGSNDDNKQGTHNKPDAQQQQKNQGKQDNQQGDGQQNTGRPGKGGS